MATDTFIPRQGSGTQLKEARERVEQLVAVITDAANKLRHWDRVTVSNVYVSFPPGLTLFGSDIDGDAFPSPQELAQALSEYQRLLDAAVDTNVEVPENLRAAIGQ